jgi:L-asparaginase
VNESQPVEPLLFVLTTGGTIDKTYFDALSEYQIGDSIAHKLLEVARVAYPFRIVEVLRKDSLEFSDEDRQVVRAKVEELDATRIVITHGTDTMTQTARALEGVAGKTIVLTGALSPARFGESDAAFNLGMAFATAQLAPAGVYITMSGQVFKAESVRKDRAAGRFVATSD